MSEQGGRKNGVPPPTCPFQWTACLFPVGIRLHQLVPLSHRSPAGLLLILVNLSEGPFGPSRVGVEKGSKMQLLVYKE
jgi:hypothetical protein